ncbi:hypothetical protein DAPPUDRAFT_118069 [Daphnia pulex]|uniref:Uncharacterized protein n=1 Tax=Daphnia pulex TaxID=6669 RepID=E9HUL5_DAPPU|nr:hypothetical protein DAPPUDRAFT_118069 [Daphnia pulex]|eukprot:EFX64558.1 hypothetical protein DAPPUDRAFT_118069 [Daphnia pulex]
MAEAPSRPPSRNADNQTEHNEDFPPLFEARTRKQLRSNEKRRLTNLTKRIKKHMAEGGSRTEVKFLRKELSNQLEECTRAHNLYRQSNDLDHVPSEDWIIQLENVTATYYGRIDEYIRTSQPENPFDDQGSASISEIRDLPSEMEYEDDLRQRLDDERLAREELERRLQQLQTDMAAKEKAGPEKEDNAATAALTEELQNLRLQMNQWKQTQDAEMANRIKLEKSLRGDRKTKKRIGRRKTRPSD